jgi:hypothetical protein
MNLFVDGISTPTPQKMTETLHDHAFRAMMHFPFIFFFLNGYFHQQAKKLI